MNAIEIIDKWRGLQCNGDWEHRYGVLIESTDNPGWFVTISLDETKLADLKFSKQADDYEIHTELSADAEGFCLVGYCESGKLNLLMDAIADVIRTAEPNQLNDRHPRT